MNAEETVKWLSELLKSRLVRTKGQVSEQIRVERSVICTGEENPTWPNKENEKHGWGKRTDANQPSKGRETFPDRGDIKEDETADGENTNPVFKSRSRLFWNYTSWEMFPDDTTWRELLSCCSDVLKKLDNPSVSLQPRETVQQGAAATDYNSSFWHFKLYRQQIPWKDQNQQHVHPSSEYLLRISDNQNPLFPTEAVEKCQ